MITGKFKPKILKITATVIFIGALLYILWMVFWDIGALYSSYGPGGTAEPDVVSVALNVCNLLENILGIILAILCFRAFYKALKQEDILPSVSSFAKKFGIIYVVYDIGKLVLFNIFITVLIKIVNATHPTDFYSTPVISYTVSLSLIFGVMLIALSFVVKKS